MSREQRATKNKIVLYAKLIVLTTMAIIIVASQMANLTDAWFTDRDIIVENTFIVTIETDSAWSRGEAEAGFQKSYFLYTKDTPKTAYIIQNPNNPKYIGIIDVENDNEDLIITSNTEENLSHDPQLKGALMVGGIYHVTNEPNTSGHSGWSNLSVNNETEFNETIIEYKIPLDDIDFNGNNQTYIAVKLDIIQ